jgi:hypothetical protein
MEKDLLTESANSSFLPMFYRKNLPHIQPPGETFFITYRLAGSLPLSTIEQLKSKYRQAEGRLRIQYSDLEKRA